MTPAEIAALREVAIRARFHSLMSVPPSTVLALLTLAEQALRLREAAQESVSVFELVENPSIIDPDHWQEIKALGDRIGYGALMSSASRSWREAIRPRALEGGEFVAGPCHATVVSTLKQLRAALAQAQEGGE